MEPIRPVLEIMMPIYTLVACPGKLFIQRQWEALNQNEAQVGGCSLLLVHLIKTEELCRLKSSPDDNWHKIQLQFARRISHVFLLIPIYGLPRRVIFISRSSNTSF